MKSRIAKPIFFLILAVGSVLRFWFAFKYGPFELSPDGVKYASIATNLVEKGIFSIDGVTPTAEVGPGFPLLLAVNLLAAGTLAGAQQAILMIQTVFGIVGMLLIYLIGRNFYSRGVGLLAMALSAIYLPLVVMQNYTLTESLFTLLVLLTVYLLSVWRPLQAGDKEVGIALLIGFLIGSQVLVRAPAILFISVPLTLALYSAWKSQTWRRPLISVIITLAAFAVTLAPWGIRNYRAFRDFIVTSSGSVDPLLAGVYPEEEKYRSALQELKAELRNIPDPSQQMAFSKKFVKGLMVRRFQEEPVEAAKWYLFGKFRALWSPNLSGISIVDALTIHFHKIIFILAFVGFAVQGFCRRGTGWFVLGVHLALTSAVYQVFLATGRYSLPFVPLLAVFAAQFIFLLSTIVRRRLLPRKEAISA